ncbi:MAG: hypothetical protein IPG71_02790 [bacterium]|nr:hypothetical protein [bacterium]
MSDGFFSVISNDFSGQTRVISNLEWQIDGGAFTPVDIADAASYTWADVLSTVGLSPGLHRLRVRGIDDAGRVAQVTVGYFAAISNDFSGQTRVTTFSEYRIDGGAYVPLDHADGALVPLNEIISTNALAVGLHSIDFRTTDNANRTGAISRAFFVVTSPVVQGENRTMIAAEVWFDSDPGVGNGIDIPLPQDGVFDEGGEDVLQVFTNQPVGYHTLGFRGQDNTGRWSTTVIDSVLVGPILVISSSGNDAILNWQFPDGIDKYYVYRAANTAGPFSVIDSTTARTYTDTGIFTLQDKGFYYVTFRDDSISIQQPGGNPVGR